MENNSDGSFEIPYYFVKEERDWVRDEIKKIMKEEKKDREGFFKFLKKARRLNKKFGKDWVYLSREEQNKNNFLYRHFNKEGQLLYVGISLSAINRLTQHQKKASWFEEIVTMTMEPFLSKDDSLAAEKRAIKEEKPKYNITHNKENHLGETLWEKPNAGGN